MPTLYVRLIGAAALVLLVILGLTLGPAACTSLLSAKKEARVAKGQAGASIEAGAEATNTVTNLISADAAVDRQTKEGTDEIDKATAGDSNDAADRAACGMRAYRDHQRCAALRGAGAPAADGGDAAGRSSPKREARRRAR
jgi:hypothetical protein